MAATTEPTHQALAPALEWLARHPALAPLRSGAPGRHELGGVWSAAAALVTGLVAQDRGRVLAVTPGPEDAEALALDLATAHPHLPVALLPVAEEDGVASHGEARANRSERLVALASLEDPADGVLVLPAAVILEDLPCPEGEALRLMKGEPFDRKRLLDALGEAGFTRVPLVAAPGEVSVRGDILDIYPWAQATPVRLEVFDDEIEDIRRFEVESQRSVETLDEVSLRLGGDDGEVRHLVELLESDRPVVLVDPPRLKDRLVDAAFVHDVSPKEMTATLEALRARPGADLFTLDLGRPDADLSLRSVSRDPAPLETTVRAWRGEGRQVALLCDGQAEVSRLAESLAEHGLLPDPGLELAAARLTAGFSAPDGGPVVAHHHELIGRRAVRRARPRRQVATRALDSLAELHPGDHVVHLTHGVAVFRGMQRLAREQGEEDFLVLEFAGETTLYVPASRIDLVERFIGGEAGTVKLDRIGGRTWSRKKEKVARAVADLASDLLQVAAERSKSAGFAYPPDDAMQARFDATFPHEDTPDQSSAWAAVRRDMEKSRPMDRLIVGDVGFGKTEVAVRAAYKAVLAGKQVAVLVPTTILADQHDDTFAHRMAEEAVRVEALSRLRTGADSKRVLAELSEGKVDVIIGTHRLLGKDVTFKDLGLVVVDEEQRFGVAHKERLKRMRAEVDVLTLSATPIPRTLHMAMSGLREISTIKTPPVGRRPVVTRVTYDSDETMRTALRHELNRGGQVFVLHNRVQGIARMLDRVQGLVPHARVAFAHGQMAARELQGIIESFSEGELDVLVCTTIVESGIDIPRANTMIVTDSHRFGLADMHQLRGRVGRESTQAYAFFLVPRRGVADNAQRRLKAIEEFSSLDAGLNIALRDLELRGAGNLLGPEQSGHILAVGYDMYCRLLRNAVASAKGKAVEEEPGELEVDLGLAAYLPSDYVTDATVRMSLLRRMAAAGKKRLDGLALELEDRFGPMPGPARELLDLFRLRRELRLAGIGSLISDALGGMTLGIRDGAAFEKRMPFRPSELLPITPDRIRVLWPEDVKTPTRRLRYLLDRFARRRSAVGSR